jgi:hypothetical protein
MAKARTDTVITQQAKPGATKDPARKTVAAAKPVVATRAGLKKSAKRKAPAKQAVAKPASARMSASRKIPAARKTAVAKAAPKRRGTGQAERLTGAAKKAASMKTASAKAAGTRTVARKASAAKAGAARPVATKARAGRASAGRASAGRIGTGRTATAKAGTGRIGASKTVAAKTTAAKAVKGKTGAAKIVAKKKAAPRRAAAEVAAPSPAVRRPRPAASPKRASPPSQPAAINPPQEYTVNHLNEADFKADGLRSYAQYRDLGIAAATAGLCQAHVIRFVPPCTDAVRKRHTHTANLQLVYVLKGWMKNEFEGIGEQMMSTGSCWLQPSGIKHTVLDYSADCEVLEIIVPADFQTQDLD